MRSSRSIIATNLILGLFLQVAVVLAIALPELEPYRQQVATAIQLPIAYLWAPLLGLLVIAQIIILVRLQGRITSPFQHLVQQTKLGSSTFAFKKKSLNAEEDHLKHFIESHALKIVEMQQEVARMESEVEKTNEASRITPEELDTINYKLQSAQKSAQHAEGERQASQKVQHGLEKELAQLKRELKHAYRDLETAQEEHANFPVDAPAGELTSILAAKLHSPLTLINNLAWRLARTWDDTPPAKIREGLLEISKQSEEQLELLKKYETTSSSEEKQA